MTKLFLTTTLVAFALGSAIPALADNHSAKGKKFEKMDSNGDGNISKSEFLAKAEERFSSMDTDGSGGISKEEIRSHHGNRKEKRKERREERQSQDSE